LLFQAVLIIKLLGSLNGGVYSIAQERPTDLFVEDRNHLLPMLVVQPQELWIYLEVLLLRIHLLLRQLVLE